MVENQIMEEKMPQASDLIWVLVFIKEKQGKLLNFVICKEKAYFSFLIIKFL